MTSTIILVNRGNSGGAAVPGSSELMREMSITRGHGLALDVADAERLYIATHHGLLVLKNERDLYRVGASQDDYMISSMKGGKYMAT